MHRRWTNVLFSRLPPASSIRPQGGPDEEHRLIARVSTGDVRGGARRRGRAGGQAQHRHHLGRRRRPVQYQRLLARDDGLQDAQHRPDCEGRHDVHGLLRRAELHRGPRVVHHRAVRPAHGHDEGRLAGGHLGPAEGRSDDRRAAQAARVRDWTVRQEPPGRPQRVSAHGARLRRVLRQPLSFERRRRAGAAGLPEGPGVSREVRSARRDGLQSVRHGRCDGRPALRKGRPAGVQGHRPAEQGADGRDRRRHREQSRGLHPATAPSR